jgi:predicted dehydrogenase
MNRVIIIGAGNIGSRHLQSLAKSRLALSITVVDPNPQALEISKKRFNEGLTRETVSVSPKYLQNLKDVEAEFDVAIVATNSDVRRSVIERLLSKSRVKYLIIEKVAFQNLDDFESVIKLLNSKKVKAWVNLPRRVIPFYQNLKTKLKPHEQVYCTVQGGEWGLACNAIHFVDCLSYLIEETDYQMSCRYLDKELKNSKRAGFVELTGSLHFQFKNGSGLNLISQNGTEAPPLTMMQTKSAQYALQEEKGVGWTANRATGWEWKKIKFKWPYQSELTHKIVEEIISTGKCGLPSIKESYLIHKPLLESLLEHLEKVAGKKYLSCPIT